MADVVQYRLERMADNLDDLERRGLFSRREIAEIVKKRRNFEYRLKRPSPLKQDYLAYIEYEKQLDSLRRLRRKFVARELKKKGNKKLKRSLSDFAGVSRILELYRLAVTRYKGDIDLWFQYLEFCRERRHGRMKQVLAQVIRLHPKVPGLWIYAAAWEFDNNLNVAAARALMQSGLRVCPMSEDLWVEYLRMELTYLNKLKARKAALGEDKGLLARDNGFADEKKWREENKDLFMSLDEVRKITDGLDIQEEDVMKDTDHFREQGSSILQTIYEGAVEALPYSMSLRKQFLEILDATDLANSESLKEEIVRSMKSDFSKEPEYWEWLATLQMIDFKNKNELSKENMLHQIDKAVQIFEEALKSVPSAQMFSLYTKFLLDVILSEIEVSKDSGLSSTLLKVYEMVESMGCMTEDLAYEYVSFYLQLGKIEEARKLAENFCTGKLSGAIELWGLRVSIEMRLVTRKSLSPSKEDLHSVFEILRGVLTKVAISEAKSLWLMAFKLFSNQKEYFEKLVQISLVLLAGGGSIESGFSLSSTIVDMVLQKDGIQQAREMYKRYLALPRPSRAIYRHCIELEANLASAGDKDGLVNARKLFDCALMTYDQDVRLWRDYYAMEMKVGTSESVNAVYWRARKILKDTTGLIDHSSS